MQNFSAETHWEKAAKTKMGSYLTKTETDFIMNAVNLSECRLIMDIGAEAGRFSMLSAGGSASVLAIDIDLYSLKRLRSKGKCVNVILADARNMPLRGEVLDAAFMIEVLDYIPDVETALAECRRVLRPKGSLVLSFGNRTSLKSRLRELRGKPYLHACSAVSQDSRELGFRVMSRKGYNWLPFGRMSESLLIPLLARAEGLIGLRSLVDVSPWVLMHLTKP
jgi:ubiquinone/menaquinone biosynthesis C-methylase UbiE